MRSGRPSSSATCLIILVITATAPSQVALNQLCLLRPAPSTPHTQSPAPADNSTEHTHNIYNSSISQGGVVTTCHATTERCVPLTAGSPWGRCRCRRRHVRLWRVMCVSARRPGQPCHHSVQCRMTDRHSICSRHDGRCHCLNRQQLTADHTTPPNSNSSTLPPPPLEGVCRALSDAAHLHSQRVHMSWLTLVMSAPALLLLAIVAVLHRTGRQRRRRRSTLGGDDAAVWTVDNCDQHLDEQRRQRTQTAGGRNSLSCSSTAPPPPPVYTPPPSYDQLFGGAAVHKAADATVGAASTNRPQAAT